MQELVALKLIDRLRDFKLRLIVDPPLKDLEVGMTAKARLQGYIQQDVNIQFFPDITLTEIRSVFLRLDRKDPLLILGERISSRTADSLMDLGINFLDIEGNAHIDIRPIYISTNSRRAAKRVHQTSDKDASIFSAKRAQTIFSLLTWPDLLPKRGVREIARCAGVSVGSAHQSISAIRTMGYMDPTGEYLVDAHELLKLWTTAYREKLSPTLRIAEFSGDPEVASPHKNQPTFISGESAVSDHLRHTSLTLYIKEFDISMAVKNRWSKSEPHNIFVRRKFWTNPYEDEDVELVGFRTAPWTLIYADLISSGDPRQLHAAKEYLEARNRLDWLR